MPKRSNTAAHSDDKQMLRQLLAAVGDGSADVVTNFDTNVQFKIERGPATQAVGFFAGTKGFKVTLVDADGLPQKWFNGTLEATATATTAGSGAVSDATPAVTFTEGEGVITCAFTGAWATSDTFVLGIGGSVLGQTADATNMEAVGARTITVS